MAQPLGAGHDAGVGGVDTVDVGVDVAQVRLHRDGDGHRAGVGAAAAQRGDAVALGLDALEAGDDGDLALLEAGADLVAGDVLDARHAVRIVGDDGDLPALPGARGDAHRLQHDGEQAGGDLLAGGDDGVVLARVVQGGGLAHPGDQLIGDARHGRDDDGDLVAGIDLALDVARDVADALDVGNRGAAELHDEDRHDDPSCRPVTQTPAPSRAPGAPGAYEVLAAHLASAAGVTPAFAALTGPLLATRSAARNTASRGLDRSMPRRANAPHARPARRIAARWTARRSTASRGSHPSGGTLRPSSGRCTRSARPGSRSCATRWCGISGSPAADCGRSRACGCWTWAAAAGSSASRWRGSGRGVTGLDPAPEKIEAARRHAAGQGLDIDYRAGRVEELAAEGRRHSMR